MPGIPRAYKQNKPTVPISINSYMLLTHRSKIEQIILKMIINNSEVRKEETTHHKVKFLKVGWILYVFNV